MTRIVASLVEGSVQGVSRSSRNAFTQGADIVEVRLDRLRASGYDGAFLSEVRERVRGPAIATLRSTEEGGGCTLRGRARADALDRISEAGFEYVDLELARDAEAARQIRRERGPDVISSIHFRRPVTRKEAERALDRACQAGDIGKVAMPCEHAGQALMLAEMGLSRGADEGPFVLIGMGDQGRLTRVCADKMGSALVYCGLKGKPAAPGQLDLDTQVALAQRNRVVLGLLGHPLAHSVSRPMQEAALRRAGLPGAYLNLDLPPRDLSKGTMETLARLGFKGINVTIPHKLAVHRLCDDLDSEASSTGAVNTVLFRKGLIIGKNTDVIGFIRAVERKIHIDNDTDALVVGAGGAARAAVFALAREGAHVTVAARNPEKARALADDLGVEWSGTEELGGQARAFDLIVNCTPLGTKGAGVAPVPRRMFGPGVFFFDMVYNPPVTRSMKAAASRKAKVAGGLDMLVGQGAESFTSWTGMTPDVAAMRTAARRALA